MHSIGIHMHILYDTYVKSELWLWLCYVLLTMLRYNDLWLCMTMFYDHYAMTKVMACMRHLCYEYWIMPMTLWVQWVWKWFTGTLDVLRCMHGDERLKKYACTLSDNSNVIDPANVYVEGAHNCPLFIWEHKLCIAWWTAQLDGSEGNFLVFWLDARNTWQTSSFLHVSFARLRRQACFWTFQVSYL